MASIGSDPSKSACTDSPAARWLNWNSLMGSFTAKFRLMIITLTVLGIMLLIFLFGKINLNRHFKKEVKELFSEAKSVSNKPSSYSQLACLPEPVKRYFRLVLKEGQTYISYARIKHDGLFKTGFDKDWTNIQGEQYATTEKPGFIWKGTTSLFTARDMYIKDKGKLTVSILSLFRVVNAEGLNFNQGELLRGLGESILYPTNLLPSERLHWSEIDSESTKLTFHYKGFSLFFIVTFNAVGEIIQMET